jgi:TusE/DsrC/DsvC family sulfur relay protein
MYDINKLIANQGIESSDPEGHFVELAHWSPRSASRMAEEDGLVLDDAHWEVIYCLRERYRKLGPDWTARQMTHELEKDFAEAGGLRHLYTLFPHGPLAQGCKLAGLPLPHGTINRSFGSVH